METLETDVHWRHPKDTVTNFFNHQLSEADGLLGWHFLSNKEIMSRIDAFQEAPQKFSDWRYINSISKHIIAVTRKWKADFIKIDISKMSSSLKEILSRYDVIVNFDYHPPGTPPALPLQSRQILLYMPNESHALEGPVKLPDSYCPIVVDDFNLGIPLSVLHWYRYDIKAWWRAIVPPLSATNPSRKGIVLFHCNTNFEKKFLARIKSYENLRDIEIINLKTLKNSQIEYYFILRGARAGIFAFDPRRSAGQIIADSVISHLPIFVVKGYHKFLARLLLPGFLLVQSIDELLMRLSLMLYSKEITEKLESFMTMQEWWIDAELSLESIDQLLSRIFAMILYERERGNISDREVIEFAKRCSL